MTNELKPCPFCGKIINPINTLDQCAHYQTLNGLNNLLNDWNTRPLESALTAQLKEAEELIVDLFESIDNVINYGDIGYKQNNLKDCRVAIESWKEKNK